MYLGCGSGIQIDGGDYCCNHNKSIAGKLKTLQKCEMQEILKTIASTQHQSTQHFFVSMANEISNESAFEVKSTDVENLKLSIASDESRTESLRTEQQQQHLMSASSVRHQSIQLVKRSKTKRKKHQKISQTRRVIFEKDGTKTTIEENVTHSQKITEKIESLSIFKSDQEVDEYVEQTTHLYESKLNEYATNITMIETALRKWMCELHQSRQTTNLYFDTIRHLTENSKLDLEQKFDAVYCRLFDVLGGYSQHVLPVLQQIVKYTMQTFPDGNLKVLHCKFGDDKFSEHSIIVSVPEILLRSLVPYLNHLHAFFVLKFVPFQKAFIKHRRKLEIDHESTDETSRKNAIDALLTELDNPYEDTRFYEIDPRVCMIKKISNQ